MVEFQAWPQLFGTGLHIQEYKVGVFRDPSKLNQGRQNAELGWKSGSFYRSLFQVHALKI